MNYNTLDMIEHYFLDSDKLPSIIDSYHSRPSQISAARLVSDALLNYNDILIEAPTGSGKTFAYLIPAYDSGNRVVISTKTKNLMDQLFFKDIPTVSKLFSSRNVFALKGRRNYFCPHRFMKWIYPYSLYYPDVMDWYNCIDRDIVEVPLSFTQDIRNKITADSHQCLYNKCSFYNKCPFIRAKEKSNYADIVITNHHLVMTDLVGHLNDSSYHTFESIDHIIFDEAHSLPDIYSNYSGVDLDAYNLIRSIMEYKTQLSVSEISEIEGRYKEMLTKANEFDGKIKYELIEEKLHSFMGLCVDVIDKLKDEDLNKEFENIYESYKSLNLDGEELKYAEVRNGHVNFRSIPLVADSSFISGLRKMCLSSVFISATLTPDSGNFEYFLDELGMKDENIITASLPSVFDFSKQGALYVPLYSSSDDTILNIIKRINGSILIICNSLSRMSQLSSFIDSSQKSKRVFNQTEGDLKTFMSMDNIVLIGCALLREGLDLGGSDFRCVIIDKLPFEYPKDLYLENKAKIFEQKYGSSFKYFFLPRAVLYFKQAAGRLIRHEDAKGLWVCMDSRILTKSYGKDFLNVLNNASVIKNFEDAFNFLLD